MEFVLDLILPETDAGVYLQLALGLVVISGLLWLFRSNKEARFVTLGAGLVLLGLMGLRALH